MRARISPATPTIRSMRTGCGSISTARTSSIRRAGASSTTCRRSPLGEPTSIASSRRSTGSSSPSPSRRARSRPSTGSVCTRPRRPRSSKAAASRIGSSRTRSRRSSPRSGASSSTPSLRDIRASTGDSRRARDASVCGRIPIRTNRDDRYFSDRFQLMPADGYAAMFRRMLDHPRIEVALSTTFEEAADRVRFRHLVYTGPIDAYYEYRYGRLPYRSLRFEFETFDRARVQPVGVINYPGPQPYTRSTEFKHLTGQTHPKTTIAREYSQAEGDPYYPIPSPDARALYAKYAARAARETNVTFVGRLAEYRYYNMDQVVASALAAVARIAAERVA